jgi:hypothetical protein
MSKQLTSLNILVLYLHVGLAEGYYSRAKGTLDIIYSYVSGPLLVASIQGSPYYVVFIDDFSRKTWIFFYEYQG